MSFLDELKRRNVIRVAIGYLAGAWLLIQILETLFPIFGIPETSVRIVVVIAAIGFVPVLVASWYFELTPEGLKRDGEARQLQQEAPSHGAVDRLIAIVLTLAVVYFAVDKFVLDPARDAAEREAARQEGRADALVESFGDRSIVVLPFVNLSADPEQEYLGDGLAEELLNLLARVEGLRVISRTSAFSFKGAEITSAEIARLLNVSYVLEGSVRKSGDRLRITAQLIDGRADAHVWSETYDHDLADIFDIQDSVAGEVVGQLKMELALEPPKAKRHQPIAYTYYLQARQLFATTDRQHEKGIELLNRALELDPGYLDAKVMLAWYFQDLDDDIRAEELVREVEGRNPDNVAAIVYRIWGNSRDVRSAAPLLERAIELEPTNIDALNTAIMHLDRLWRADEAVPIGEYAIERDPLNAFVSFNLARAYLNCGAYDLAEQTYRAHIAIVRNERASWGIGLTLLLQDKASEALQHFDDNVENIALRLHGKTLALHDLGRTEDAQFMLTELLEIDAEEWRKNWLIGTAYAWIGATDEALEFFAKQREQDSGIFRRWAASPLYANLEDDPRWRPFLASVELDPEFLASVEFNPRLPSEIRPNKTNQ